MMIDGFAGLCVLGTIIIVVSVMFIVKLIQARIREGMFIKNEEQYPHSTFKNGD